MILNQQRNFIFKAGLIDYGNWQEIVYNLIARTVEIFLIGCLF